jgi:hypothetical protein
VKHQEKHSPLPLHASLGRQIKGHCHLGMRLEIYTSPMTPVLYVGKSYSQVSLGSQLVSLADFSR